MFTFKNDEEQFYAEEITFARMREGETFCHYFPAESYYMKKTHVGPEGKHYHTINLKNGESQTTSPESKCILLDIQSSVSRRNNAS